MTRRLRAAALALPLVVAALVGTSGAAHADEQTATPPGQAWVRVGHFVPGMGAASVELEPTDGTGGPLTLASRSTYGEVSTYGQVTPGSYTATVRTGEASGDEPVLSRQVDLTSGEARTVAVVGTADAPRLVLLSDDLTPPSAGTARIRVLSAAESAADITVSAVGGPTIAEGAVLGQATDYTTVPAGSWTLQLQAATTSAVQRAVPVASGSVYTIVVLDAQDEKVRLDVVTDAAGAMAAPKGGARTGGGGTATAVASDAPRRSLGLLAVAAAFAAVFLGLRRPRRHPARDG